MDTVSTTIEEWDKKTMHFKVQWDKADAISLRKPLLTFTLSKRIYLMSQETIKSDHHMTHMPWV